MLNILTWDSHNINDGTNYTAGFTPGDVWGLPDVNVQSMERVGAWPVFSALRRGPVTISLFVSIEKHATLRTLRGQLMRWFDPEDETPKRLVITDADTAVPRYIEATCQQIRPVIIGTTSSCSLFRVDLVVHGDVRWRAVTPTAPAAWNITATAQTRVVANSGEDEAYPVIEITPTAPKTGGYTYKRHDLVTWRAINAGPNYPVRLGPLDTATLVTATKMQADGDDLRVFVDGAEVSRHLVAMNNANTYIWFSVNWLAGQSGTLKTNLAGAGSIDSIELEFDDGFPTVSAFPETGALRIQGEVFLYTGLDLYNNAFTGITRGVWGTAAAAHAAAQGVYWMQHEVVIVYGNAAATAPTSQPATVPIITLASSTNGSWLFDIFGADTSPSRPASWLPYGDIKLSGEGGTYSATERTLASPYTVAGMWSAVAHSGADYDWKFYNPCGITNADWANGKMRAVDITQFSSSLYRWIRGRSFWTTLAAIPAPGVNNVWDAWTEAAGAAWDPACDQIAISIFGYNFFQDSEVGTVIVTLFADEIPLTSMGAEEGNYSLSAMITNETTGEAITITFEMAEDEDLEIDTYQHTVTYLLDNSNQFQAIALSSARRAWLRLLPGNNTLRFDDVGTDTVTVSLSLERRYY